MSHVINLQNRIRKLSQDLIQARADGDVELAEEIQDLLWDAQEELEQEMDDEYDSDKDWR